MEAATAATAAMVWFRMGLRVHDNPALDMARRYGGGASSARLYPVFVLDQRYIRPDPVVASLGSARAGVARVHFLLWNIGKLCFEFDAEPYALTRDKKVRDFVMTSRIEVFTSVSHTLFNPAEIINKVLENS